MCPLDPALLAPPPARFHVSPELADRYMELFVNTTYYSIQGEWSPTKGKASWYLAKDRLTEEKKTLDNATIRKHIDGDHTINLYPIDPTTQRGKWVAIDADYEQSLKDLVLLRHALSEDGIEAALEMSRRGGHLWVFADEPLLASKWRIYIYNLALRIGLPVLGGGIKQGLEVFPKQDTLEDGNLGNAIRAPLGIHRRTRRRYWFMEAEWTPEAQMVRLLRLKRVTGEQLDTLTLGMNLPEIYLPPPPIVYKERPWVPNGTSRPEFRILDHVRPKRTKGRNHWAQCPSCARANRDTSRDNLAIQVADPRFYICWAGCTKEDIREALHQPLPKRQFA